MKHIVLPLGLASVLQQILNDGMKEEIKGSVNNFVFPLLDAILLVVLIIQIVLTYKDYQEHGQIQYVKPLVVGICFVVCLTAPLYMWTIIGW